MIFHTYTKRTEKPAKEAVDENLLEEKLRRKHVLITGFSVWKGNPNESEDNRTLQVFCHRGKRENLFHLYILE